MRLPLDLTHRIKPAKMIMLIRTFVTQNMRWKVELEKHHHAAREMGAVIFEQARDTNGEDEAATVCALGCCIDVFFCILLFEPFSGTYGG